MNETDLANSANDSAPYRTANTINEVQLLEYQ